LSSIASHVSESSLSDTDAYKVKILWSPYLERVVYLVWHFLLYFQVLRLLDFLVSLLEHPLGKVIERLFFLPFPLFLFLIVIMTILNCVVLWLAVGYNSSLA
jgi:hypothetical protein